MSEQTERDGLPSVLIHGMPEGMLAIVRVGHQGRYYGDANARLIAAAPDLLTALRGLDAYWTTDFPEGPDGSRVALGGFGEVADDTMQVWRDVRAAIAKAEGRS